MYLGHHGAWLAFAQLSDPRVQMKNRWKEYHTGRASYLDLFQSELRDSFKTHHAYFVLKEDGVRVWVFIFVPLSVRMFGYGSSI